MTIETKYNIGDEVWFLYNREPVNKDIRAIKTGTSRRLQYIKYVFRENELSFEKDESELFPTKEELLKSL